MLHVSVPYLCQLFHFSIDRCCSSEFFWNFFFKVLGVLKSISLQINDQINCKFNQEKAMHHMFQTVLIIQSVVVSAGSTQCDQRFSVHMHATLNYWNQMWWVYGVYVWVCISVCVAAPHGWMLPAVTTLTVWQQIESMKNHLPGIMHHFFLKR